MTVNPVRRQQPRKAGRATRKSAAQSRELILAAARELFGQQGFTNAGVKDIATKAGVAEIVVYRIFGTKIQLFEEVIFGQLVEAIVGWFKSWELRSDLEASSYESCRAYVDGVYRMVSANRGQILALLSAEAFEPAFAGERTTSSPINTALGRIESLVTRICHANDWGGVPTVLTTRVAFSMIFSVAMFPDTILPPGSDRPSDEALIDEMTKLIIYGVSARPDGPVR